jgi:hypothetical protein
MEWNVLESVHKTLGQQREVVMFSNDMEIYCHKIVCQITSQLNLKKKKKNMHACSLSL